jgi:hypothetical protein
MLGVPSMVVRVVRGIQVVLYLEVQELAVVLSMVVVRVAWAVFVKVMGVLLMLPMAVNPIPIRLVVVALRVLLMRLAEVQVLVEMV